MKIEPPLAVLCEITHRCPLACPYCSNPLELARATDEMPAHGWIKLLREAAALGVLQVHFSGGEPAARRDLEALVEEASRLGLYTNLITSGLGLPRVRLERLAALGLDHVQLSFQDAGAANANRIAGHPRAMAKKLEAARDVRALGFALTVNFVVHRANIGNVRTLIDLGVSLGAGRIEIAHAQYYGWALRNRAALMPSREALERALAEVEEARARLKGEIVIDHVVPDYYAERPKACMGGWGRRFIVVDPRGDALPCHAARTIPGLTFDNVALRLLSEIWSDGEAFARFRGATWMGEPCASCERRDVDFGGCRCQALALVGDASLTDPACGLSPRNAQIRAQAEREAHAPAPEYRYRRAPISSGSS